MNPNIADENGEQSVPDDTNSSLPYPLQYPTLSKVPYPALHGAAETLPIPEVLRKGAFPLLKECRDLYQEFLKDHGESSHKEAMEQVKENLHALIGDGFKDITRAILHHVRAYPQEPQDGFDSVNEYKNYVDSTNDIFSAEFKLYSSHKDKLGLRDPLDHLKNRSHILIECADGRNSMVSFLPEKEMLSRFGIEWLPVAGLIVAPDPQLDASKVTDPDEYAAILGNDPELKARIFERFEMLYGPKIEEFLVEHRQKKSTSLLVEFQSHFDSDNDHHGCGAHGSNLMNAQLETIKDCLIMEKWLSEKYSRDYEDGAFRVFRTVHDTGKGNPIYSAKHVDARLPEEGREKYGDMFAYAAKHFEAPHLSDPDNSIVRPYQENHLGINEEAHDEQTVRISNLHLAHTLVGQSVMEICWFEDPQLVFNHLKVLLGIIDSHYGKKHPEKPFIVHFDLVKGNQKMHKLYEGLKILIMKDKQLQDLVAAKKLEFLVTETDRKTFHAEEI